MIAIIIISETKHVKENISNFVATTVPADSPEAKGLYVYIFFLRPNLRF